jgi:iron complex transport system substrate-binding protein
MAVVAILVALAACSPPPESVPAAVPKSRPGSTKGTAKGSALAIPAKRATRIVSLDYCADQFVLEFADRAHILALSPDAGAAFSYKREAAVGLPTVRPRAEDVLVLAPDFVLRSYGGGPNVHALFQRAGVPLVQIGFADTIAQVHDTLREVSTALGVPSRGEALIQRMTERLAMLKTFANGVDTLYLTPSGFTAGAGTLVGRMLEAAGLQNFQTLPGWRQLPLERLAYEGPQLAAFARFGSGAAQDRARTPVRHPVARRRLANTAEAALDGATTTCGGWFLVDAVEVLAAAGIATGRAVVKQ